MTYSLSFCWTGNTSIFPSFPKVDLAAYRIPHWLSFFWCFENIISLPSDFHSFWWEIIFYSFEEPLYVISFFFSCFFQNSLFGFQEFDYDVSGCGLLWVYLICSSSDLMWGCMFFITFGEHLTIISSNILFVPFSLSSFLGFPWHLHWYDWWRLTDLCSSVYFLHSFFLIFFRLDNLSWPIIKFADYFFCPSGGFFISAIVILRFRISICFFSFYTFYHLLILSVWWDITLIRAWSSLNMISFTSLNIF